MEPNGDNYTFLLVTGGLLVASALALLLIAVINAARDRHNHRTQQQGAQIDEILARLQVELDDAARTAARAAKETQ